MSYDLIMHPDLIAQRVHVDLVGAGGSGSLMLSGIARLDTALRALGHPGFDVTVWDPDTVSEANLGRQLFAPADVGHHKAAVLVTRTNAWFGTAWHAAPCRFSMADDRSAHRTPILVSCVDSARARAAIGAQIAHERSGNWRHQYLLWLDLGNRAADGQVVLGIPAQDEAHAAYEFRLPTVLELFPELLDGRPEDDAPSCSLAQALERQNLFVNQAVATPALELLWQVFRVGRIGWHGAFVNLETGRTTPLPVDPQAWKRFGYEPPRKPGNNPKEPQ